ncbi:MAG TPA: GntG family PLP-dependent aldolase [Gemmatimonadaceae bacterium]|nr:GntG family PLP-dependent aldolase [Gemmatimonadaceae bacterium]
MPGPTPPIDLRSDTVTRPTPAMRRAMADAEVGDDVLDGDPTVRRLEARVAELLGKEDARFFPSGTMANQTALWVLTTPGTDVLLDADAHIVQWEMAAAAALSGVQLRPVLAAEGRSVASAADLERAMRPESPHAASASLVCVENTHNGAGGAVTPAADLLAIGTLARSRGLAVHLDGARLWNAHVATGTSLEQFARAADTVMLSFSKGLGCPVGATLAGDAATIRRAHVARKRLGGGMRQSGILAAAALHALDAHLDRLVEDHANARLLADIVGGVPGVSVVAPDTNIVIIDLPRGVASADVVSAAQKENVLVTPWNATRVRAVTHLDVDAAGVKRAGAVVARAIGRLAHI